MIFGFTAFQTREFSKSLKLKLLHLSDGINRRELLQTFKKRAFMKMNIDKKTQLRGSLKVILGSVAPRRKSTALPRIMSIKSP